MSISFPGTNVIRPLGQFLRSAQLERDFADAQALHGYAVTPQAVEFLNRIENATRPECGDRSFRLLGDYGSGKSTFALLLAHWMRRDYSWVPRDLMESMRQQWGDMDKRPPLSPLLVTCSREPLAQALQRAVSTALAGESSRIPKTLRNLLKRQPLADNEVVPLLISYRDFVAQKGHFQGILLIVDEAGKLLEYAAQNPSKTDVYLWQTLSEVVGGSKATTIPFLMVSIFHQGFAAYASELGMGTRREWEKVAGRFSELNFQPGIEQTVRVLSSALNIDVRHLPDDVRAHMSEQMRQALAKHWYGRASELQELINLAPSLFPVSPFVVPPLARLLRKYGQNERSMFSFLFGGEPNGPLAVLEQKKCLFNLEHLFDYVHSNFDTAIASSSEASRWLMVKTLAASVCGKDGLTDRIVKSIGVLNLLNADDLMPSKELLVDAFAGEFGAENVLSRIESLASEKGKRIIYDRGEIGGLSLWSHVSVDLNAAYNKADAQVGPVTDCMKHVLDQLGTESLVARRHYMETGNLRFFTVLYCSFNDFDSMASPLSAEPADGTVLVPLCQSADECNRAEIKAQVFENDEKTIVAVPREPVTAVSAILREALVWDCLVLNTPELNSDPYAQEAVSLQQENVRRRLTEAVHRIAGVGQQMAVGELKVFWKRNEVEKGTTKRALTAFLSEVCDTAYQHAPRVSNELLNRNSLTSAGAAAQMRLIEGILERSHLPLLGMELTKRPPERSMYLSLLQEGHVHQEGADGEWAIHIPNAGDDPLNLRPALLAIHENLGRKLDAKVTVSDLLSALSGRPYGVRKGLAHVLLAVFAIAHEKELAIYEEDRFLSEVTGAEFQRLVKKPETFAMQLCRVDGLRRDVYSRLAGILQVNITGKPDLLAVVRPLCIFAAQLPPYVANTKRLSPTATAIREVLLHAREPVKLLFTDLPKACSLPPIETTGSDGKPGDEFLAALRAGIHELRQSYYDLRQRIIEEIRHGFDFDHVESWRQDVGAKAEALLPVVSEPNLKSFCFRLSDCVLSDEEWVESVAALLASKPPREWTDREENVFKVELGQAISRMKQAESAAFGRGLEADPQAVNICITKADGRQVARVVSKRYLSKDVASDIRHRLQEIIDETGLDSLAVLFEMIGDKVR